MPQPRQYADAAARQRAYRTRQAEARLTEQHAKGIPSAAPIATLPSRARWQALLDRARLSLETAHDEIQAYCEERSEAWQEGDRAAALADRLAALEQVLDDLDPLSPFSRTRHPCTVPWWVHCSAPKPHTSWQPGDRPRAALSQQPARRSVHYRRSWWAVGAVVVGPVDLWINGRATTCLASTPFIHTSSRSVVPRWVQFSAPKPLHPAARSSPDFGGSSWRTSIPASWRT